MWPKFGVSERVCLSVDGSDVWYLMLERNAVCSKRMVGVVVVMMRKLLGC